MKKEELATVLAGMKRAMTAANEEKAREWKEQMCRAAYSLRHYAGTRQVANGKWTEQEQALVDLAIWLEQNVAALGVAEARGRAEAALSDDKWMEHCEAAGNQARAEGRAAELEERAVQIETIRAMLEVSGPADFRVTTVLNFLDEVDRALIAPGGKAAHIHDRDCVGDDPRTGLVCGIEP
jgi:hypothetical protein